MKLLIVTLAFPPEKGGGSVYYKWLVDRLALHPEVDCIVVLTGINLKNFVYKERQITLLRILPNINSDIFILKLLSFFLNSIALFITVPIIITHYKIQLLHYHCRKNYLAISLLKLFQIIRIPVVADSRDLSPNLPLKNSFDAIIACSLNIVDYLKGKFIRKYIYYIPVPLYSDIIPGKGPHFSKNHIDEKYILYSGDITLDKGILELMEAMNILNRKNFKYKLKIIGHNKIHIFKILLSRVPNVEYVGPVSHKESLNFIRNTELIILPSKSEGLGRVCLEGLLFKKKVIFPPKIPEFEKYCPKFTLREISPDHIADKLMQVVTHDDIPQYPLEMHDQNKIFNEITMLYKSLIRTSPHLVNR